MPFGSSGIATSLLTWIDRYIYILTYASDGLLVPRSYGYAVVQVTCGGAGAPHDWVLLSLAQSKRELFMGIAYCRDYRSR